MHHVALTLASSLALATLLAACPPSDDPVGDCDPLGDPCQPGASAVAGGWAEFCEQTELTCINVCNNPNLNQGPACASSLDCKSADGTGGNCLDGECYFASRTVVAGGTCEYDGDCSAGNVCDNDTVNGSSCTCVPDPCTVTLSPGTPVPSLDTDVGVFFEWVVKRRCCDEQGTTWSEQNEVGFIHLSSDPAAVTAINRDGKGEQWSSNGGRMCGDVYAWNASIDAPNREQGSWTFSSPTRFSGSSSGYHFDGMVRYNCTSSGAAGADPPEAAACMIDVGPTCVDVAGTWDMSVTNVTSSCGGEEDWTSTFAVAQSGCDLVVDGIKRGAGGPVTGTVAGDVVTIGPHDYQDDGGVTTTTFSFTRTSPTTLSGQETWSWSDATNTCGNGTAGLAATRQ